MHYIDTPFGNTTLMPHPIFEWDTDHAYNRLNFYKYTNATTLPHPYGKAATKDGSQKIKRPGKADPLIEINSDESPCHPMRDDLHKNKPGKLCSFPNDWPKTDSVLRQYRRIAFLLFLNNITIFM